MKKIFMSVFFVVCLWGATMAQIDVPFVRQAFHSRIDKVQLSLKSSIQKSDDLLGLYSDSVTQNNSLNDTFTDVVDSLQSYIEKQSWDSNTKMKYLRGLADLLETYSLSSFKGMQLINIVEAFGESMDVDKRGGNIAVVMNKYKYEVASAIAENYAFQNNEGKDNFNNILIRKKLYEHPLLRLEILKEMLKTNPDISLIDSVVHEIAIKNSDIIYTYAQSYTLLGKHIRLSRDPLVSTISKIANAQDAYGAKVGRQYMPFLDRLYHADLTFGQIDDAINDPVKYFKLLVQTEINYAGRAAQKDTAIAWDVIKYWVKSIATNDFINVVNGLHEKPNDIRYALLKPLSPLELYYLIVTTEEDIYTSTYVNGTNYGIYRMIWKNGGERLTGDSLFIAVKFDYFKKWIKMSANYNTLDDFLRRMKPENAKALMKAFVGNIDKTNNKDSLEDAVDVAGSYSSLNNPILKKLVLDEVHANLQKAERSNNPKAYNIYYILNTLFLSMDSSNKINISAMLGIDPVYFLPINKLKDTSGKIMIQQFTYGDEDGSVNYEKFMNTFRKLGWKISENRYWSTVSSLKGIPITIYTNRPLDEKQHLDDDAQEALNSYLEENDIHPTLAFHRGHSFYLPSSIRQLQSTEKLVFLRSCGGFQSLNEVLKKSPGAQIISTKQTGAGDLNLPMMQSIIQTLQNGQNLQWLKMWRNFNKQLSRDTRFADYIPPYENLGAVFLLAYLKLKDNGKG